MVRVHHFNCVDIRSPFGGNAIGHCVLLESPEKLVLIDTGIGMLDTAHPVERIGKELIDMVGFRFDANQTAYRQMEHLGLNPADVTDCVISHLDNDHIGGLADFPSATVHVAREEWENFNSGNPRYLKLPLAHHPNIKTYSTSERDWFGFESRKVDIDINAAILLVPLFGHTLGHCGIALKANDEWLFYIGDAYYLREELTVPDHPISELAAIRADNNEWRLETLDKIRRFVEHHPDIKVFGYHDAAEFYDAKL